MLYPTFLATSILLLASTISVTALPPRNPFANLNKIAHLRRQDNSTSAPYGSGNSNILFCAEKPYYQDKYTCYQPGNKLCPILGSLKTLACGDACYLDSQYSCNNGQLTTIGGTPVSGGSSGTVYSPSNNGLGGVSPSPYPALPSPLMNGLPPYPQASATDSSSSDSSGAPADASTDDSSSGSDNESGDGGDGGDSK